MYNVIVAAGAKIDERTVNNKNALLIAIQTGHREILDLLLPMYKLPHQLNDDLPTEFQYKVSQEELNYCLYTAITYQHETLVKTLLENRADPNYKVQTALLPGENEHVLVETASCFIIAATYGNINIVDLLLKNNADVNVLLRHDSMILNPNEVSTYFVFSCFSNQYVFTIRLNLI